MFLQNIFSYLYTAFRLLYCCCSNQAQDLLLLYKYKIIPWVYIAGFHKKDVIKRTILPFSKKSFQLHLNLN